MGGQVVSVTLIPGAGHFVPQEKPVEFNRALERIIAELRPIPKPSASRVGKTGYASLIRIFLNMA